MMTLDDLKLLLRRYYIRPNKILGQNFLLNDAVLQTMANSVLPKEGEAVLEIGPGIGNLTSLLLERASFVLAVEKDDIFIALLRDLQKNQEKKFRFVIADILRFNFSEALSAYGNYHVVANIPYYITGKIIQMLLRAPKKPNTITLLLQREVAENLTAKVGALNVLALSVQLYGETRILEKVPAADFYPKPKVDSAIVQIKIFDQPKYKNLDEKKFFQILHACFAGKRKQIHNTLVHNLHLEKAIVSQLLENLGIPIQARPQELSLEQWVTLTNKI